MTRPYEGHHLIADLHGAVHLTDIDHIERALVAAAVAASATLIEVRLHSFGPGQGITGMAMLAESHISIHTWPEYSSACVDLFMCGGSHDLEAALGAIIANLGGRVAHRAMIVRNVSGKRCAG